MYQEVPHICCIPERNIRIFDMKIVTQVVRCLSYYLKLANYSIHHHFIIGELLKAYIGQITLRGSIKTYPKMRFSVLKSLLLPVLLECLNLLDSFENVCKIRFIIFHKNTPPVEALLLGNIY